MMRVKIGMTLVVGVFAASSVFGATQPLVCKSEDLTLTVSDSNPEIQVSDVILENPSANPTLVKKYFFYRGMYCSGCPKEREWHGNFYNEGETNILKTVGELLSNYTTKEVWVELHDSAISSTTKTFKCE